MTGYHYRITREGRPLTVEIDRMTDVEIDRTTGTMDHATAVRLANGLARWIRDHVREPNGPTVEGGDAGPGAAAILATVMRVTENRKAGAVIIEFGSPVSKIAMSPEEAFIHAEGLFAMAQQVRAANIASWGPRPSKEPAGEQVALNAEDRDKLMRNTARAIESTFRDAGYERPSFVLVTFTDPTRAQYISNCVRDDTVAAMRHTADRLEMRQDKPSRPPPR